MQFELSSDELILALVSVVRAVDPRMLRQGMDGFDVDFRPLEEKEEFTPDDRLLLKCRAALESPVAPASGSGAGSASEGSASEGVNRCRLELEIAEARRLAETLERLESLQPWPPDVLQLSRNLRARLASVE